VRLERYSREHRHFVAGARLPPLLAEVARPGVIADLGCGDGAVLAALEQLGLLEASFAIDLSPERVAAAERAVPSTVGIVASASATGLPDASVDGVVCSQVIEHIPDDRELAPELARILRPGGWFYVGSVLRHRHAFWFYKVEGVRRLDPTHVREYGSLDELLRALADPDLRVERTRVGRYRFPLSDLALRALARTGLITHDQAADAYRNYRTLIRLRALTVSPPGFRILEVAGLRSSG
jgi:SAM-dependent methyltransferase